MKQATKWHIFGVLVSAIISLIGLTLLVWQTSPADSPLSLKVLFFAAIFTFICAVATLADFKISSKRIQVSGEDTLESAFYSSFFRGLLLSVIVLVIILIRKIV